jgi:hypothetical protein
VQLCSFGFSVALHGRTASERIQQKKKKKKEKTLKPNQIRPKGPVSLLSELWGVSEGKKG